MHVITFTYIPVDRLVQVRTQNFLLGDGEGGGRAEPYFWVIYVWF
jgi:hypothetical protein